MSRSNVSATVVTAESRRSGATEISTPLADWMARALPSFISPVLSSSASTGGNWILPDSGHFVTCTKTVLPLRVVVAPASVVQWMDNVRAAIRADDFMFLVQAFVFMV